MLLSTALSVVGLNPTLNNAFYDAHIVVLSLGVLYIHFINVCKVSAALDIFLIQKLSFKKKIFCSGITMNKISINPEK